MTNQEYADRLRRLRLQQQMGFQSEQQMGIQNQMANIQAAQMMALGAGGFGQTMPGIHGNSASRTVDDLKLANKISASKSSPLCWDFDDYMAKIDKEIASE